MVAGWVNVFVMVLYTTAMVSPAVDHQYGGGLALLIVGWIFYFACVLCLIWLRRLEFVRQKRIKEIDELLQGM